MLEFFFYFLRELHVADFSESKSGNIEEKGQKDYREIKSLLSSII